MGHQNGACEPVSLFQSAGERPVARPHSLLVITAHTGLRGTVAASLQQSGFMTRTGSGLHDMLRQVAAGRVDLIILELGSEDGFHLLRELRSRSDIPVIIAASDGRDPVERLVGFELGADDYVTKPFNPHELVARARAILRRTASPRRVDQACEYHFAGLRFHRASRRVFRPDGSVVTLTKGEQGLLVAFLAAPGRTLTREHLLRATRVHEDVFDRSIDVQVLRLRRKLEHGPGSPRLIETERGAGYVFAVPIETSVTSGRRAA